MVYSSPIPNPYQSCHATAAQLPLHAVAVKEGGFEALEGVGQDRDLGLETPLRYGVRAQAASAAHPIHFDNQ